MKFMVLIHSNPKSRDIWAGFSDAQRAAGMAHYAELAGDLAASGELIVSHAIAAPAPDGPFAEVKEYLAGFFLLDCASPDRAGEIAARLPEAPLGLVEVRRVREEGELWK